MGPCDTWPQTTAAQQQQQRHRAAETGDMGGDGRARRTCGTEKFLRKYGRPSLLLVFSFTLATPSMRLVVPRPPSGHILGASRPKLPSPSLLSEFFSGDDAVKQNMNCPLSVAPASTLEATPRPT